MAAILNISNPHLYSYYHVTAPGEPANYVWTLASAVTSSGGIARYSGVNTSSPLDATVTSASSSLDVSSLTVPFVTTASPGAMLIGSVAINSSGTSTLITSPTGMTERWDLAGKRQDYSDTIQATAGGSGDKTWSFSAPRAAAGWLGALKPAS
jgi:hypothetical protein